MYLHFTNIKSRLSLIYMYIHVMYPNITSQKQEINMKDPCNTVRERLTLESLSVRLFLKSSIEENINGM